MATKSWSTIDLESAVKTSRSVRQVIIKLGLRPAGGNYRHVKRIIEERGIDDSHFTGMGWNIGLQFVPKAAIPLSEILKRKSDFQSHKLKNRLFKERLKLPICEMCGWNKKSQDGRIPVELDHINGDKFDNRIENLRILCPNCHSLQPTHRGLNRVK